MVMVVVVSSVSLPTLHLVIVPVLLLLSRGLLRLLLLLVLLLLWWLLLPDAGACLMLLLRLLLVLCIGAPLAALRGLQRMRRRSNINYRKEERSFNMLFLLTLPTCCPPLDCCLYGS